VLRESSEALDARYALRRDGWAFDRLLGRVAAVCGVPPERVLSGGRQRPRSMARAVCCYWAARLLGIPAAELARRFNISAAAVSRAVARGEILVAEQGFELDKE